MSECRFCNVRFNLDKPEHQRAWQHLQNMDRSRLKSYSNVIVAAINKYFEDDTEETAEEKLITRIVQALKGGLQATEDKPEDPEKNIPWGFLSN